MAIIVTYDVPEKHIALKKALFQQGYTDKIIHRDENGKDKYIYLPNTTVYHSTKDAKQGRDDVQANCNGLNIKLERCISTQWGPNWAAIYGEPFGS